MLQLCTRQFFLPRAMPTESKVDAQGGRKSQLHTSTARGEVPSAYSGPANPMARGPKSTPRWLRALSIGARACGQNARARRRANPSPVASAATISASDPGSGAAKFEIVAVAAPKSQNRQST